MKWLKLHRRDRPHMHQMKFHHEDPPHGRMLAVCTRCGHTSEIHHSGHVIYAEIAHQSDLGRAEP